MDVLISGKSSFKLEVPYRLLETGPAGGKPLIVYLHGFGQNLEQFISLTKSLHKLNAYHLYIQGPYPVSTRIEKNQKWGYAWYLYNGKQGAFVRSLEYSSEFIQEIIDGVAPHIAISRICILGYSMGGYQAGYFGLSRWKHTNELITIAGRIKTEAFKSRWGNRKHINVLALHGEIDESVRPGPQKEQIEILREKGLNATFLTVNEGHRLNAVFLRKAKEWLLLQGYTELA